jgi:hypothetical protein
MNLAEYAKRYGISSPAAQKWAKRKRWTAPDGITYTSRFKNHQWVITEETSAPAPALKPAPAPAPKPTINAEQQQYAPAPPAAYTQPKERITPEQLKAKKTFEEIRKLQLQNERLRSELLNAWTGCLHTAFSGLWGELAAKVIALRLPKETATQLDAIIRRSAETMGNRIMDEVNAFEEENKGRLR